MTRKVTVQVVVELTLNMEDGKSVCEVIEEMDYDFTSKTEGVDIVDTEICDHTVTNSR